MDDLWKRLADLHAENEELSNLAEALDDWAPVQHRMHNIMVYTTEAAERLREVSYCIVRSARVPGEMTAVGGVPSGVPSNRRPRGGARRGGPQSERGQSRSDKRPRSSSGGGGAGGVCKRVRFAPIHKMR